LVNSYLQTWLEETFFATLVAVPVDPKILPSDPATLKKMVVDLTAQMDTQQTRLRKVERLLEQLLEARNAKRSERLSRDQLTLFAAEAVAGGVTMETAEEPQDCDEDPPSAAGGGGTGRPRGRKPLASHLKRERIEHDLAESEKHCADCGEDLRWIGEETSERYEYIPAHMLVIEDVCRKYACSCTVRTASKPSLPIAKSTAGASLLAQVIVSKMADHLPLHRQAKIFRRHGVEIADQTMCGWMAQSAALMQPLYQRLKKFALASKVVGTDDTPVKVLDRSLPQTRKGRIWPYTGDRDHPAVIYDYTRTRERAGPEEFLKDYRGYLQADAYAAYDSFFTKPERGMTEVACWAHTRRHFHKALDSDASRMRTVLLLIAQLYRVEKTGREQGLTGDELLLLREHGARPVLEKLREYLREIETEVLPKSPAGQAVAYALKNWTALTRYCGDPDLAIDNNHTERSLRGFAVGRNNWTFFGSDRGGRTAATLRSFVSSCELMKIDPFVWFRDVLSRIGEHPVNRLDELLPHNWVPVQP
jgi:transposase